MSIKSTRALAAIFFIAPLSSAYADLVKIEFEGIIDSSQIANYADLAVGSSVQGSFVYDSDWEVRTSIYNENAGDTSGDAFLQIKSGGSVFSKQRTEIFTSNDLQPFGTGPYRDIFVIGAQVYFEASPAVPQPCNLCYLLPSDLSVRFDISQETRPTFLNSAALPKADDWPTDLPGSFRLAWLEGDEGQLNVLGSIHSYTVTAVPEPSEWAFMLGGLGLVAYTLRRRTRQ